MPTPDSAVQARMGSGMLGQLLRPRLIRKLATAKTANTTNRILPMPMALAAIPQSRTTRRQGQSQKRLLRNATWWISNRNGGFNVAKHGFVARARCQQFADSKSRRQSVLLPRQRRNDLNWDVGLQAWKGAGRPSHTVDGARNGMRASTRVPCPGLLVISSVPPSACTR